MDWQESIKAVQEACENNRLVIFVGSGVSRNSDIPTWGDLIDMIAKKIKYTPSADKLSKEEYLLIPEYYYLKDRSRRHKRYYKFISDALYTDKGSNDIDDIIFTILPEHIITTNYDFLLENSSNPNVKMYEVISQDSDLLSKANNRYIIKMHGSLDNPQTIVLKESDYIDYEQNHPLILSDVLTADTSEEIKADIADVFCDCTADEVYLMLAVAENLKKALRMKKIVLKRE